jgi:predicted Holliday junction resolvase-like endonuclease
MSDLLTFLGEGRHIFSMCPECGEIHRLTDLQLSRKGKYVPDWLDKMEAALARLEERKGSLDDRARALQAAAKEKAERRVLPQLLKRAVPAFYAWGVDPRDVRTLIHPVEFVAFRGMNSRDGVREVTFLNLGPPTPITKSIDKAVEAGDIGWATLRLGDEGSLEAEEPKVKKGQATPR